MRGTQIMENKIDYKKFLLDNGAYRQFCDNLLSLENQTFKMFWDDLVKRGTEHDGGSFSFSWSESVEGFEFWNSLDTKWHREQGVKLP